MPIPSTPSIMPNVLGYAADTVQIPETTPTGQGIPSFRDLFPFITQVDPNAGGVMVERAWMNALFNLLGQHAFFQQSGCVYPWQATLNYIAGSHVKGSDDDEYIALQPSGPDVSGTGAKDPAQQANRAYWVSLTSFVSGDFVPDSRRVIAGTGLTGGGPLSADVTLAAKLTDSVSLEDSTTAASAKAVKAVYDILEAFRLSMIGVPRYWRSTTLPAGYVWANGDLVLFSDWPELKKVYDGGGFTGMLLAYNATSATIAANLGKWRPNAANPTGLYVPNLSEQFFRAWTGGSRTAGSAQEDAIRNITGKLGEILHTEFFDGAFYIGSTTGMRSYPEGGFSAGFPFFDISRVVPTANENRPANVALPVALYLASLPKRGGRDTGRPGGQPKLA